MNLRISDFISFRTLNQNAWATISMALLAIAAYLINHPYAGLVHDSRIYLLQALNWLRPEIYQNDLFFAYGSQTSYTFFPAMYGVMIKLFGVGNATFSLMIASQILWVFAAYKFYSLFFEGQRLWFLLALLFILPARYAPLGDFAFSEPFVTARPFSEALALMGFVAYWRRQYLQSVFCILISISLHPLMPIGVAIVMLGCVFNNYRQHINRNHILALCVLAVFVMGVFLHVAPRVDEQWEFYIKETSPLLFMQEWTIYDWLRILQDIMLLLTALIFVPQNLERIIKIILFSALAVLALSYVGFDLFKNLLFGRLQLWRILWFMHFLTPVSFIFIVEKFRKDGIYKYLNGLLLLLFLISIIFSQFLFVIAPITASVSFILLCYFYKKYKVDTRHPANRNPYQGMSNIVDFCLQIIILLFLIHAAYFIALLVQFDQFSLVPEFDLERSRSQITIAQILSLLVLFILAQRSGGKPYWKPLILASCIWSIVSVFCWDRRDNWSVYVSKNLEFSNLISNSGTGNCRVYSPLPAIFIWIHLKCESYVSATQAVGKIFSREMSVELSRRVEQIGYMHPFAPAERQIHTPISESGIRHLCSDVAKPTHLILDRKFSSMNPDRLHLDVPFPDIDRIYFSGLFNFYAFSIQNNSDYYIYDCRKIGSL